MFGARVECSELPSREVVTVIQCRLTVIQAREYN